ncbi:MAG TPA: lamin tail domain-containing protein [Polyangiales bacterium]|nr:lamin tail domain-containing protein [Polyangiales bacterium]
MAVKDAADGGEREARAGAGGVDAPPAVSPDASAPRPSQVGALVITEIMIDPRGRSDQEGEWFELYNPGDRELDAYGCTLADGSAQSRVLPNHLRIAPQSFVTVARGEQVGFKPDLVTIFSLKNGADSLELTCDGVSIDRVAYDKAQGFPVVAGAALSLDPARVTAGANDFPSAWCLGTHDYGGDLGSPAQPNPPCDGEADDAGMLYGAIGKDWKGFSTRSLSTRTAL